MIKRHITSALLHALKDNPVVLLNGARQTGKSTLVQHLGEKRPRSYESLDDLDTLELAGSNPEALVNREGQFSFDEVQRSPALLLAVKRAVDKRRIAGRFILTGSANLLLMKRISETLAGRAVYFSLLPLSRREVVGRGSIGTWRDLFNLPHTKWRDFLVAQSVPHDTWQECALRGGYPVPSLQLSTHQERTLWFTGYAQTYLERDLHELGGVSSLVDFRRLMRAICLRLGNIVNQTELARDIGLSQPTVHRHLDLLEVSHQLIRLPAYSVNRTKRLIKAPKAYWTDTALALHLAGENQPRGCHFENMILSDLLAWQGAGDGPELFYWRTTTGEEVDFVVDWNGKLLALEVKATTSPRLSDASHLLTFREQYGTSSLPSLLVHTGSDVRWLVDGVLAVPWWKLI